MKKTLLTFMTLAGLIYACKNPIENVVPGSETAEPTNVEVRFKPQNGVLPKSLDVQIIGPDADKIVTNLNTRNFHIDQEGVLNLAAISSTAPNAKHPIRFTVVATADNFLEVVQPVELSNTDQRLVPITLLAKQASTPVVQATAQSDNSGALKSTVTIQTSTDGLTVGQTTVTIPQGTQMKDVTNEPVDGNLTVTMLPVATDAGASQLPNGGLLTDMTTATGQPVETQQLSDVAGAVSLEIYNKEYQTVKTFSKPIRVAFAIDAKIVNPETNEQIKAGDRIPLFSYDAATDRWQQEQAGLIELNTRTGQLECIADVPHLSTWAAGYSKATCSDGLTFKVKSNFKEYDAPFLCQVVYLDKKGKEQGVATSFYRSLIDGSEIEVANLNRDQIVRLKVYENAADLSKFVASETVGSCSKGKTNIDVRSFKSPSQATALVFAIQFPCKNVNEKLLPEQVTAEFRETGTANWQDLVTLYRKDIKGDRLEGITYKATKGKRYDLRLKVLGYYLDHPSQLVDKNEILINLKTKEFCKK